MYLAGGGAGGCFSLSLSLADLWGNGHQPSAEHVPGHGSNLNIFATFKARGLTVYTVTLFGFTGL